MKPEMRILKSIISVPEGRLPVVAAAFITFSAFSGSAATTNTVPQLDYSTFRLISERNIFNPKRIARANNTRSQQNRTPTRNVSFTLVGTMSYEKGTYAFMDGTSSDYRKVLKPNDTIAGYKVVDIAPSCVKLEEGTNLVSMPVGMQLRQDSEGQWHLAEAARTYDSSSTRSSGGGFGSRSGFGGWPDRREIGSQATSPSGPPNGTPAAQTDSGGQMAMDAGAAPANPDGTTPPSVSGEQPGQPPGGPPGDVLEALRRRAAAERGE